MTTILFLDFPKTLRYLNLILILIFECISDLKFNNFEKKQETDNTTQFLQVVAHKKYSFELNVSKSKTIKIVDNDLQFYARLSTDWRRLARLPDWVAGGAPPCRLSPVRHSCPAWFDV